MGYLDSHAGSIHSPITDDLAKHVSQISWSLKDELQAAAADDCWIYDAVVKLVTRFSEQEQGVAGSDLTQQRIPRQPAHTAK